MSRRSADGVFDVDRFRADVTAYMRRWHLTPCALGRAAELAPSTAHAFITGRHGPSLLVACALADICDLTLDQYRRDQETAT